MRHAADLNYQTCLIEDGCGCAEPKLATAMIDSVLMECGIFGAVAHSSDLIPALEALRDAQAN